MARSDSLLVKTGVIVLMGLLLLIPISLLDGLVAERELRRASAVGQIARGWGGKQAIGGPLLVVPTTSARIVGGIARELYVLPRSLVVTVQLDVDDDPRRIGMYEVPVFVGRVRLRGEFDFAAIAAELSTRHPDLTVHWERARVVIPVGDLRGIRGAVKGETQLLARALEPAGDAPFASLTAPVVPGIHTDGATVPFALDVTLAGTQGFDVLPLAGATSVQMQSNWPHPGFAGGWLPREREITARGFSANWQVLALSSGLPTSWLGAEATAAYLTSSALGAAILQPVDLYARIERAVKYAGLFIAVTLLSLFLWEHLSGSRLHPIQYGLLGLALSVFYLLLLALAEHIGFDQAYALAALALSTLLGTYLAGALRNRAAGTTASVALGVVYAVLFLIVTAEDYALLAGALSLFALLAAVMLLTRRLDWYRVQSRDAARELS